MNAETRLINNVQYSLAQLEETSGPGQVALYNLVTGESVKKFSDRKAGAKRLWALGQPIAATKAEPTPAPAKAKAESKPKGEPAPKAKPKAKAEPKQRKMRQMTFRLPPRSKTFRPHREGTHRARLIEMLGRASGATFEECRVACDWDKKTTYEGIRLLNSLLGYGLFHETQRNGEIRIWLLTTHEEFREKSKAAKEKEQADA